MMMSMITIIGFVADGRMALGREACLVESVYLYSTCYFGFGESLIEWQRLWYHKPLEMLASRQGSAVKIDFARDESRLTSLTRALVGRRSDLVTMLLMRPYSGKPGEPGQRVRLSLVAYSTEPLTEGAASRLARASPPRPTAGPRDTHAIAAARQPCTVVLPEIKRLQHCLVRFHHRY